MIPPPPRSSLFPYTTLFRSGMIRQQIRVALLAGSLVAATALTARAERSEEHTSELQSLRHLVCRLLLEKKNLPLCQPQSSCKKQVEDPVPGHEPVWRRQGVT